MKQTTIKVPEHVHGMAQKLSEELRIPMSLVVDLALRLVASGKIEIAPYVTAGGAIDKKRKPK